jgi:hypothetical protein
MRAQFLLKVFVSVPFWAACVLAVAEGQERPDALRPAPADSTSRPWNVPGMKVIEPGIACFFVSDVCDRWIATDGNLGNA